MMKMKMIMKIQQEFARKPSRANKTASIGMKPTNEFLDRSTLNDVTLLNVNSRMGSRALPFAEPDFAGGRLKRVTSAFNRQLVFWDLRPRGICAVVRWQLFGDP